MDEANAACAFTRNDTRIFNCAVCSPAVFALALILIIRRVGLRTFVFTSFVEFKTDDFKSFFQLLLKDLLRRLVSLFTAKLFYTKFEASKLDNIKLFYNVALNKMLMIYSLDSSATRFLLTKSCESSCTYCGMRDTTFQMRLVSEVPDCFRQKLH